MKTPLSDRPNTDSQETSNDHAMISISNPSVPMNDIPDTGDVSAPWLALTALSGSFLAGAMILGRKKHEDGEEA